MWFLFILLKKRRRSSIASSYDVVNVTELMRGTASASIAVYKVLFPYSILSNSHNNEQDKYYHFLYKNVKELKLMRFRKLHKALNIKTSENWNKTLLTLSKYLFFRSVFLEIEGA